MSTSFSPGQRVVILSGDRTLYGTVTRVSQADNVWVDFKFSSPLMAEVRFVRSQDGEFRRYGHSTQQSYPTLQKV